MGRRVLLRHIWGYSVCLCPIKGTPGLNELILCRLINVFQSGQNPKYIAEWNISMASWIISKKRFASNINIHRIMSPCLSRNIILQYFVTLSCRSFNILVQIEHVLNFVVTSKTEITYFTQFNQVRNIRDRNHLHCFHFYFPVSLLGDMIVFCSFRPISWEWLLVRSELFRYWRRSHCIEYIDHVFISNRIL